MSDWPTVRRRKMETSPRYVGSPNDPVVDVVNVDDDLPDDLPEGEYMLVPVGSRVFPPCVHCGGSGIQGAERVWVCDFWEANDPSCYPDHPDPKPAETAQPRKHKHCGWRVVVKETDDDEGV